MKTITDDPQNFFETGGWTFLDPESGSDEEGEDGESEEDEQYMPSDMDSDEESDEDSEYSEASEDDDDDDDDDDGMAFENIIKLSKQRKNVCTLIFFGTLQSLAPMKNPAKIGPILNVKQPKMMPIIQPK